MARAALIPDDERLRAMTPAQISALANDLASLGSGAQQALEWLSDALLRINRGWESGAHSELADTRRNRRIIGAEIHFSQIDRLDDSIRVAITDQAVRSIIGRAASAGLTRAQQLVFALDEAGLSQASIADQLNMHPRKVSRVLCAARDALWGHVDRRGDAFKVFLEESHRAAYFPPGARRRLPPWMESAREVIEAHENVTTHIEENCSLTDKPMLVQIRNCYGITVDELSFRRIRTRAKKMRGKMIQVVSETPKTYP